MFYALYPFVTNFLTLCHTILSSYMHMRKQVIKLQWTQSYWSLSQNAPFPLSEKTKLEGN
jgi:hypothetical protein